MLMLGNLTRFKTTRNNWIRILASIISPGMVRRPCSGFNLFCDREETAELT
jgi:hypothetical protein